jgi:bifunctional UDP-N-acetylglucosamine pyrophosphorylase / glucosamine-1-phosphate N-acetyltransferase
MALDIVIMAAGLGKRMQSRLPKVLHTLAGRPLIAHVLDTALALSPRRIIVVVGHGAQAVRASLAHAPLAFVDQWPPQGTGHAVMQAGPLLGDSGVVLILNGDVPLMPVDVLPALVAAAGTDALALLSAHSSDAGSYGRIIRGDSGHVQRIVEAKDASLAERAVTEWYTGTMAAPIPRLHGWLDRLTNVNAQKEYYLTDIVGMAAHDGVTVTATIAGDAWRVEGVNQRSDLAALERRYQRFLADQLMSAGVALADPARIDIRGTLAADQDVAIDVGCVFEGKVTLAGGVSIGPYCVIKNATLGANTKVHAYTHIDEAEVGANAVLGPYARLRPGTQLAADVHVGNFVELKATSMGQGSKANHLTYLGDTTIGRECNIGAGTITCNYDGANKHPTHIGDRVHVGSDVQLVAPLRIGDDVTVGAGTTVWKDVDPGELVVNPKQQTGRKDWRRPQKAPKKPL